MPLPSSRAVVDRPARRRWLDLVTVLVEAFCESWGLTLAQIADDDRLCLAVSLAAEVAAQAAADEGREPFAEVRREARAEAEAFGDDPGGR